ncbi:biotin transporter BioY [Marinivivus vitaminiproducens]|uniref:biotin transporter BioY n=1 Tax=Marinivivus vitaminiproducens TaxID=3035935 RepID=UPI0027A9B4F1|nr:biotin transporter BioY [Geminicoccaceae bacterium SCSIO 64248]
MPSAARSIDTAAFVPLRLNRSGVLPKVVLVLIGSLFLAASAQITVPMIPVPMTMQTYAVLVIGALCGWRLGALTVMAYLAEASLGLPFFSNGAAGAIHLVGPTGGYLLGFVLAAGLMGWMAERGWTGAGFVRSNAALLLAHAVILAAGVLWLAVLVGPAQALAVGFTPFILATVLKTALAYATIEAWRRSA